MMVCGADLLESFRAKKSDGSPVWSPEDQQIILSDCGIICATREGTDLTKVINGTEVLKKNKKNIEVFSSPVQNNISSTLIRKLLKENKSIMYLVTDGVRSYIKEHNIGACKE